MNSPRPNAKPTQPAATPADADFTKSNTNATPDQDQDRDEDADADDHPQGDSAEDDPQMQGEGNYTAARRHRESVESFVKSGRVEPAARQAAPDTPEQAQQMQDAEAEGRSHARK